MSEPRPTYDEPLPELTQEEVRTLIHWGRRVKAGEQMLLRSCPQRNEVVADPIGETERPNSHTA